MRQFTLRLSIGFGIRCASVCVFGKHGESIMGCTAEEYDDFVERFESAPDMAEQMLLGVTMELLTRKNPRPEGDDKVKDIRFSPTYVPVMHRLKHACGESFVKEEE